MAPRFVPPPLHSHLSHRSPFVTYTGSWLALASHHSWVSDPEPEHNASAGAFKFAFDGTDFAVYGAGDAHTAAWVHVDGRASWWQPEGAEGPDGLLYRETVEPGFHRVEFRMEGGRMDLVKVVVGDGLIGPEPYPWEWWHVALGASAMLLAATRVLTRRRRTAMPGMPAIEVTPPSEKV